MPKKSRKTKKKSAVLLPTEINIVDEGQSSLDVSDLVRKQKEVESERSDNPVIEVGEEASETSDNLVVNAEANNFSVTEVTSLRKVDSLAVSGRQESINSNFSFFSDNNLTEKDELEDFNDQWEVERVTVSSVVTERSSHTKLSSLPSKDASLGPALQIEELLDSDVDDDHKSSFISKVESVTLEINSDDDNNFLGDLRSKILEENTRESEDVRAKSKISWDNLVFKREIKIGFQESEMKGREVAEKTLGERFAMMLEDRVPLSEESLRSYFPEANIFLNQEDGYGFVSSEKSSSLSMKQPRGDPFNYRDKGIKAYSLPHGTEFSGISSGSSFFIFRHFLHLPSLTEEEKESLTVLCLKEDEDQILALTPVALYDDFVVVESSGSSVFLLVSDHPSLPLNTVFIPFLDLSRGNRDLVVAATLPGRGFLREISETNPKLVKVGYEERLVLRNGLEYNVAVTGDTGNQTLRVHTDSLAQSGFIRISGTEEELQDYVELSLSCEHSQEMSRGTISLYDKLRVDQDPRVLAPRPRDADIGVIDRDIRADDPQYGNISNIEPFYSCVRDRSLNQEEMEMFLRKLGSNLPHNQTEISLEEVKKEILLWKSVNGGLLYEFVSALIESELKHIADEICNNLTTVLHNRVDSMKAY